MKKRNLFFSLIVLGLVSCNNNIESIRIGNDMLFSAKVDHYSSRVTNNQWDGDELIGVSLGGDASYRTYNVTAAGEMSSDNPYIWEGTAVDVKAWTPLTEQPIDLKDQSTEEKFYLSVTVQLLMLMEQSLLKVKQTSLYLLVLPEN